MNSVNQILDSIGWFLETGTDFLVTHLLTVEGIIGMVFFSFLVGVVSKIRSPSF